MSKFRTGTSSSVAQRVWLMAWYVLGIISVSNPYFTDQFVDVTYRDSLALLKKKMILVDFDGHAFCLRERFW